jgi:hypothetical protein
VESRFLPHTWQNHSKWHDLDRCPAVGPALSDKCGKSWASGGDEIFLSGLSGAPSVSLALSSVNARRPYLPPAELVASSHAGVADECLLETRRECEALQGVGNQAGADSCALDKRCGRGD